MHLFDILHGLLFIGIAFIGLVVLVAACIKNKPRLAVRAVVVTLGLLVAVAGISALLFWLSDPFVRKPVAKDAVAGTYHLDPAWAQGRLLKAGYKDGSGRITLKPDGSFTATMIPACCVHGQDEVVNPLPRDITRGYYNLAGTWTVGVSSQMNAGNQVVRLAYASAWMTDDPPVTNRNFLKEHPSLEIDLMKGTPLSLGFSIFNGDFEDVLFLKNGK